MRYLILGQDGYMGTALTGYLQEHGDTVAGVDNGLRKKNVSSVESRSIVRKEPTGFTDLDILSYDRLTAFIKEKKPDVVVHLAEQPSAPFSMKSPQHAFLTQQNNVLGTLNVLHAIKEVDPNIHLIKLGTEGEYPDWLWTGKTIPEGNRISVRHEGDWWKIPTPRYAGSWYHFSKLHDSMNIDYACRIWGLRATDVNQGVVYGHRYGTRLDTDYYFGTVVHRFVAQAVAGKPLTVYGTGGQTRGFICLQNSIEAIRLLAENPPQKGEFRVIHQTTQEKSVIDIASMVSGLTGAKIHNIENPRAEASKNNFRFDTATLDRLGLKPIKMEEELPRLLALVKTNKDRIPGNAILPEELARWK